jgi:hypothetical protein
MKTKKMDFRKKLNKLVLAANDYIIGTSCLHKKITFLTQKELDNDELSEAPRLMYCNKHGEYISYAIISVENPNSDPLRSPRIQAANTEEDKVEFFSISDMQLEDIIELAEAIETKLSL